MNYQVSQVKYLVNNSANPASLPAIYAEYFDTYEDRWRTRSELEPIAPKGL